jgi:hypothetical protein
LTEPLWDVKFSKLFPKGGLVALPVVLIVLFIILCAGIVIVLVSPLSAKFDISRGRKNFRIKYLGFRFENSDGERKTSFLFIKFKTKNKPEKEEIAEPEKPAKKKKPRKKGKGFRFDLLIKKPEVFKKTIIATIRAIIEIISSARIKDFSLRIVVSDPDPATTGAIYGWLSALKYSAEFPFDFDAVCDFAPDAKWDIEARLEVRITFWRTLVKPAIRLLMRLPKWELYKIYRESKKKNRANSPVKSKPEPALI